MRADPGLALIFFAARISRDDNRAAGEIFRDLRNDLVFAGNESGASL